MIFFFLMILSKIFWEKIALAFRFFRIEQVLFFFIILLYEFHSPFYKKKKKIQINLSNFGQTMECNDIIQYVLE